MVGERIHSWRTVRRQAGGPAFWPAGFLACWLSGLLAFGCSAVAAAFGQSTTNDTSAPTAPSRVVVVHDAGATEAYVPRPENVRRMMQRGLTQLTGKATAAEAWRSLVSPKDVIGIKVFTAPGGEVGTRVAVVEAAIEGLLQAKVPPTNLIIWDKQRADLRRAGFMDLAARHGVRVEGSANAGYDEQTAYTPERPVPGQLVWGDLEFGSKSDGAGRRSFVSRLLARSVTKIINITPLLNHNTAGVSGHLYSLALGSVDNSIRFENDLLRLSVAVPEIYALPSLSDRVVLNITDALICQYQGEHSSLLHYSTALNELRFSKDPVALDVLSLRELNRLRGLAGAPAQRDYSVASQMELLQNAALLELGVADERLIKVERVNSSTPAGRQAGRPE
jgi:hypothetical protein